MNDETLSPAPEPVEPTNLEQAAPPETELATAIGQGDDLDGGQQQPDDFEELEWDGKKFVAPKSLKDGILRQADYTRKTQEVAETRKALEIREQQIAQQAAASEEELNARVNLMGIDAQIKQYAEVNWDALEQEDPIGAQQHWRRFTALKEQRNEAYNDYAQKQAARTQFTQQDIAKRIEETRTFARSIPGWTPEMDSKVIDFAKSKGVSDHQLAGVINPKVYEILNLARLGEQLLTKQQTAAPKAADAPQLQPLTVVGARANPTARKSLSDMSMEEYAAARKAGRKA